MDQGRVVLPDGINLWRELAQDPTFHRAMYGDERRALYMEVRGGAVFKVAILDPPYDVNQSLHEHVSTYEVGLEIPVLYMDPDKEILCVTLMRIPPAHMEPCVP